MDNCIFCKIVKGEIPSPRLYEDEKMIVISDVAPKAKAHYLCIPKLHFPSLSTQKAEAEAAAYCFAKIPALKDELGLSEGYRVVINQGKNGDQTVPHLHIHLLGGEPLGDF